MSIACCCRHIPYTKWRLHVFRDLFYPAYLQPSSRRGTKGGSTLPQCLRGYHRLTSSSFRPHCEHSRNSEKLHKNDENIGATLKGGARRTTSLLVTVTSPRLYPNPSPTRRCSKNLQGSAGASSLRRNPGQKDAVAQKQIEEANEATKGVNCERTNEPKASSQPSEHPLDGNQDPKKAANLIKGANLGSGSGAHVASVVDTLTSIAEGEGVHERSGDDSLGKEPQSWSQETVQRARMHDQILGMSAADLDPFTAGTDPESSKLYKTRSSKLRRALEPREIRAQKPEDCTKQPVTAHGQHDSPGESGPEDSPLSASGNLKKVRLTLDGVEFPRTVDYERATQPHNPSNKRPTKHDKVAPATAVHSSSIDVKEHGNATPDGPKESESSPVPVLRERSSGILSHLEHEQLSALIKILPSMNAEDHVPDLDARPKPPSTRLPSSPYQHLEAKKRIMKKKATSEAKQRLQDNPWAQWLASPIRMCQATGTRLPNKLMVGWSCVRNPKDDQIYLMPEELTDFRSLGVGDKSVPSSITNSDGKTAQGTVMRGSLEHRSHDKARANALTCKAQTADNATENGGESTAKLETKSDPAARNPPIPAAKMHMRPSSILILKLNKRMLITRDGGLMKDGSRTSPYTTTNNSVLNRLLPSRWKDQAHKFGKSADARSPQSGFLTPEAMRKVKWHPNIHDVMLSLLRSRVLKGLEYMTVKSRHETGMHKRIIPLPLAESDGSDKVGITTTLSGTEQAVFLWLGRSKSTGQYSQGGTERSPSGPPVAPSTCPNSTLRFIPVKLSPDGFDHPSTNAQEGVEQGFTPFWTHLPTPPETENPPPPQQQQQQQQQQQRRQQQYIPYSIALHLHLPKDDGNSDNDNDNDNENDKPTTRTVHLPTFNLPSLLGASSMSKLYEPTKADPAIIDVLGLDRHDASGWVMVKGGGRTKGLNNLVQEIWTLWLFLGGRSWDEDEDEDEVGEE